MVDRLGKVGLVERHRWESDRRMVSIRATRKGMGLEAKVRPRVEQAYAELRGAIASGEWEQLIAGLDRLASIDKNEKVKTDG